MMCAVLKNQYKTDSCAFLVEQWRLGFKWDGLQVVSMGVMQKMLLQNVPTSKYSYKSIHLLVIHVYMYIAHSKSSLWFSVIIKLKTISMFYTVWFSFWIQSYGTKCLTDELPKMGWIIGILTNIRVNVL